MELKVEIVGEGKRQFESLIKDIIMDLGVSGSIESLRMYLDPREPIFALYVRAKPSSRMIRLADVTEISKREGKIIVKILDERFSPTILSLLEKMYKDKVSQSSRHEIVVEDEGSKEELEGLVVCDYADIVRSSIMELVKRIMPEGFRSVKMISKNKYELLTIASEDPLTDELAFKVSSLVNCS
ncbi:MAG: methanogenesis marker 17 protein [Candidatus Nezhaarchaeales archaeon]